MIVGMYRSMGLLLPGKTSQMSDLCTDLAGGMHCTGRCCTILLCNLPSFPQVKPLALETAKPESNLLPLRLIVCLVLCMLLGSLSLCSLQRTDSGV